jgi:hypothetical protein
MGERPPPGRARSVPNAIGPDGLVVYSGTIHLDSASSNRNSRRFTAPNSWDICFEMELFEFEGGSQGGYAFGVCSH